MSAAGNFLAETLHGPSPSQFAELFPFHLIVDSANRVVQTGRSLGRICPGLAERPHFDEFLRLLRPAVSSLADATPAQLSSLALLQVRGFELQLRGQILPVAGGRFLFVGSPWITEAGDLQRLGLSLEEFALHDPSLDLIHAVQAQRMAADDHRRLVERLKFQRAELQAANAQLKLREAEASKLALVAARTNNGVIISDREGRIEWVNEGFCRLTGYAFAEVVGRTPGSFLQGEDTNPQTVEFIRRKLKAREGFHAELVNYDRDGRRYWVDIEVQPVLDEHGEVTNFVAIEQDITARVDEEQRRRLQQSVSTILAETDSLEQGLSLILRSFGTSFAADFAGCWPVENATVSATPIAVWSDGYQGSDGTTTEAVGRFRKILAEADNVSEVLHRHLAPAPEASGENCAKDLLVVPCRTDGKIVAKLFVIGSGIRRPEDEMLRLLGVLGNQVGQFITRKYAGRELQRSRDFALQVMNLMGQGLTVTNERGEFTFANESFIRLAGRTREELIGMPAASVLGPADQEILAAALPQRRVGQSSSYEVSLLHPVGEPTPVLVTGVPRFEKGRIAGSVAVVTDLTEQKRVERQMAAALARERELNTLKSSFVTMASHEFRTPLTSIVYAAEMLGGLAKAASDGNASRNLRYLDIILDGARRMSDLMNDLLLLGRIESGKLTCAPVPVELAGFAEELKRESGDGHARIAIRLGDTLPSVASLDTAILRHALLNLLSNALKYSPAPSEVTLSLELERPAEGEPRLCFRVRDRGCGIPEADQEKMFQAFFRASNVGKIRGTGIGLTIARDCARLHGGELSFTSRVGDGTTFCLRIPCGAAA